MAAIPMNAAPGSAPTSPVPQQYLPPRPLTNQAVQPPVGYTQLQAQPAQPTFNDEMARRQQQIAQFNQQQQMRRDLGAQNTNMLQATPFNAQDVAARMAAAPKSELDNGPTATTAPRTATLAPRAPTQVSQPTSAPRTASVPSQARSITPTASPTAQSVNRQRAPMAGKSAGAAINGQQRDAAYKRTLSRMA
jgi:hypothetical protein